MRNLNKILDGAKHFDLSGFRDNNYPEIDRKEDKVEFNGEMYILEDGILVGSMNKQRVEASGTKNICTLLLGMSLNDEKRLQFWEMQPFVIEMRYPNLYEVNLKSGIKESLILQGKFKSLDGDEGSLKFQGKYLGFGYELPHYHTMLEDIEQIRIAGEYINSGINSRAYQILAQIDSNKLKGYFEKGLMLHINQVGKISEINLKQK